MRFAEKAGRGVKGEPLWRSRGGGGNFLLKLLLRKLAGERQGAEAVWCPGFSLSGWGRTPEHPKRVDTKRRARHIRFLGLLNRY